MDKGDRAGMRSAACYLLNAWISVSRAAAADMRLLLWGRGVVNSPPVPAW